MKPRDMIDEGVLADARKVDNFVEKHDPGQPSIENTLRLLARATTTIGLHQIRDIRIAEVSS